MAALDWITIKGFRSIARIEQLRLHSINVLIGPNGSGKSNFIGVFSFLNAVRNGELRNYVLRAGGAERLLHFGSKHTTQLRIHISFEDEVNQYRIDLSPSESDGLIPSREVVYFWDKLRYPHPYKRRSSPSPWRSRNLQFTTQASGMAKYVQGHFDKWRLYHFHDTSANSPMKKTADVNDNRRLRSDGSNLAPYLYFLREKHQQSYELIRRTTQLAAPFFEDFQLEPLRLNEDKIRLEWRHRGSDAYFDSSSLSDGTLRFMALATLLLQPSSLRPSIIIMDEPELGLHPMAITLFASLVKQASEDTQVVLATQSSLLLDHFSPEDVFVADRVEGATELTRLRSEELKEWLDNYSLGQLWEKNEIGGRPASASMERAIAAMTRLLVHVEGETEESFVKEVLAPHLVAFGFSQVSARLIGNSRQRHRRGGIRAWPSVRKDIVRHLKQDRTCVATTMVDYYGLPQEWPGRAKASTAEYHNKASLVESAIMEDVRDSMSTSFDSRRFVPYLVMHEFEALLFSDCQSFGNGIGRPDLASRLQGIRDGYASPEEIDDSPIRAPSKRIKALIPAYDKVLLGTLAMLEIGLPSIRAQCPHFSNWLSRLEGYGAQEEGRPV